MKHHPFRGPPSRPAPRLAELITAWARRLYYWVYTPCMVGFTALLSAYILDSFWPDMFGGSFNGLPLMFLLCPVFALGLLYIRGVMGTKVMNMAINIIPLILFSIGAISYRVQHPEGSKGYQLVSGTPIDYEVVKEQVVEDGKLKFDSEGQSKNKVDEKADGPVPR